METLGVILYIAAGLVVGGICARREAGVLMGLGEPAVIGVLAFLFWPLAAIGLFFAWIAED